MLGNGDVVVANGSENTDLLHAAAGGHGVLGLVTLLDIQLIKAFPFVEVTCVPVEGISQATETMQMFFEVSRTVMIVCFNGERPAHTLYRMIHILTSIA